MKTITINQLSIDNFKGIDSLDIKLRQTTDIYGANGSGKTTIVDAFRWLISDQDSTGSTKFDIRPLTPGGEMVDNVDIVVCAYLTVRDVDDDTGDINEEQVTLCKVQRQKWIKKRGSETASFQGNENVYEINCFPASQKEFQAKVDSIIPKEIFLLMTSPKTFALLKWQDQRKILMGMVDDVTDESILNGSAEYTSIREDVMSAGVEKALEKARKAMARLKEAQKALPIRIDEASKAISIIPGADEIDARRTALTAELQRLDDEYNAVSDAHKDVAEIKAQIIKEQYVLMDIDTKNMTRDREEYEAAKRHYEELKAAADKLESDRRDMRTRQSTLDSRSRYLEGLMADIRKEYEAAKNEQLPENSLLCPTCGRELTEDKITELRASFESRKTQRVEEIKNRGNDTYAKIKSIRAELAQLDADIAVIRNQQPTAYQAANDACQAMRAKLNTDRTAEYPDHIAQQKKIDQLQAQVDAMDDGRTDRERIYNRQQEIREELDALNKQHALIEANVKARRRVEDLTQELRCVSQQVADQERIVYLLEQFSRAKMDALSERINEHFKIVKFKLFDTQINGAIMDTCEMTVNGVPYASLNSASQVQGGLDVINALSSYYKVSAPIFIDNRESTSHIPEMDAQIINLYVSDADKDLRIETK